MLTLFPRKQNAYPVPQEALRSGPGRHKTVRLDHGDAGDNEVVVVISEGCRVDGDALGRKEPSIGVNSLWARRNLS